MAFSRFVDELVQNGAPSGILAIRGHEFSWSASPEDKSYQRHGFVGTESDHLYRGQRVRYRDAEGFVSQINGDTCDIVLERVIPDVGRISEAVQAARDQLEPIQQAAFADFEGAVDDLGYNDQMAVYRVTLPSGGLDPQVGRSPAAARAG